MAQLNIPIIAPVLNQMVTDLQTQFESQTTFYNSVVKRENKGFVSGKGWRIPSNFNRPTGITAGNEGFSFNPPGLPVYDDMHVYPARVAQAYQISGDTLRNFSGQADSQIDSLAQYTATVALALTKDIERNCAGDGSGLRATCVSATGSTLTLASTPASSYGSTKGSVWLNVGETYDVITSAGAVRGQVKVSAVPTNTTATVTFYGLAASDVASTDILVPQNGYLQFPRGLAFIVNNDTGVFQLNSRSTRPQLKANVVDLAGAAITVSDFDQAVAFTRVRGDMLSTPTGVTAWLPVAQHSALVRLGQNLKRFPGEATKFDGSFQEFGFGTVIVRQWLDCDEDRVYFLNEKDLFVCEQKPFGVYNDDGNEMRMAMGTAGVGSDSWVGAMGIHFQMGAYQARGFSLIKRASVTNLPTQVNAGA